MKYRYNKRKLKERPQGERFPGRSPGKTPKGPHWKGASMTIECWILRMMRHYTRSKLGDAVMPCVTRLGDYGAIWIGLAAVMFLFRKGRRPAAALMTSLLIEAVLCSLILKPLIGRPRPFELSRKVRPLIEPPKDRSFPSGHTASSIAAAASLFLSGSPLWMGALPLALLITWSRLYVCVHFVTDILGGIGAGLFSALAGNWLVRLVSKGH